MDLGVPQGAPNLLDVYSDNNGVIEQTKEPRQQYKNKHILMCLSPYFPFCRLGSYQICKIHTNANVVDPSIKPPPQPKHEVHTRSMHIRFLEM
jgi:hypothetical protein